MPRSGPCSPWCLGSDVAGSLAVQRAIATANQANAQASIPALDADEVTQACATAASAATEILYRLSGAQFSGICGPVTIRPVARPEDIDSRRWLGGLGAFGYAFGWSGVGPFAQGIGGPVSAFGDSLPPEIDLGGYPVQTIVEVKIDGTVIPAVEYDLRDFKTLVRMRPTASYAPTERYGWPTCLTADTLILTERGMVPIVDVAVGDRVLTHKGRWRKVLRSWQTGEDETVVVRGHGGSIRCTPEHRFFASEIGPRERIDDAPDGSQRLGSRKLGAPTWLAAQHLVGSAWATPKHVDALPIPLPDHALPAHFWWVVGRWIGDGWTDAPRHGGNRTRVVICCGSHESDQLGSLLADTGWEWRRQDDRHTKFRVSAGWFSEWLTEHFGTGAHGKQFPAWLFGAPEDVRRAVLAGYVSADGYNAEPSNGALPFTSTTTVSKALAIGTRILAAGLGYPAAIYERRSLGGFGPDGALSYRVDWPTTPANGHRSHAWNDGEHIWTRVRDVTLDESVVPVYDLEVEDDHSFIANGLVLHNSQINDLPDTEVGTFAITYSYGQDPGEGGRLACLKLAEYLALPMFGDSTRYPQRVTGFTRQGVSAMVVDVMDVLNKGSLGIYEVDSWLLAVNPHKARKRSSVWSPELAKRRRTSIPTTS